MGLSASQARLLSITQRLNNNELESQLISNSKVQLSTKNSLATEKYIAALDSTEMSYVSYDTSGTAETVALTFNSLMSYSPLKNQYSLYNSQGQLMVSEEDAMNFETSQTLSEFLMKNGLDDYWNAYNEELMKYNSKYAEYEIELKNYYEEKLKYEEDLKDYYENQLPAYEAKVEKYNEDLELYNLALTAPDLNNIFTTAVATPNGYNHYTEAKNNNDPGCLLHLLNCLLDYGFTGAPYNTSLKKSDGTNVQLTTAYDNSSSYLDQYPTLKTVSDYINSEEYDRLYICDGIDVGVPVGSNLLQIAKDENREPTEYEILASDYYTDEDGNFQLKTLRQKTIDMYYLIANSTEQYTTRAGSGNNEYTITQDLDGDGINDVTVGSVLTSFIEGDMKHLTPTVPTLDSEPIMPTLDATHPTLPTFTYNFEYPVADKEKAQWYTNLWYAMDGQKTTAQLGTENDENAVFKYFTVSDTRNLSDMEIINATYNGDGTIKTINKAKQLNQYYVVIDKENATDSSWIQYMLTSGMVTMQQAALRTTGYVTWEGIEFSSTSDIKEIQDDTKVAKAEAEYEEAIAQIQAEDKILDAKVKKLDTEHSALKTEIESIKNVMTKNIEKSFNTFS